MTQRRILIRLLALILLAPAIVPAALAPAQRREFIFAQNLFPSAHASTLVELRDGTFLSAWFAGTAEGAPDVAIWASFRSPQGWSKPFEMAREPGVPCWNPVLFHAASGRLWLYYKFGPSYTWWTAGRRYSDDDGKTWSPAQHLPAGLIGPVRTRPLLLPSGLLVSGSSVESYGSWAAWVELSKDDGDTWQSVGPVTLANLQHAVASATPSLKPGAASAKPSGIIQPSIVPIEGAHLRLYARSSLDIAHICIADSFDNGQSWTAARPLALPNPNSGIDAVRLRDGRIVLIYNDTAQGRSPLNLAVSSDGEHFQNFATLESGPGEFSYPAIVQGSDGDLHLTYTFNRKQIAYVVYPLHTIPKPTRNSSR